MLALGAEADVLGEFSFEGMLGDKIPVRLKFAVNGDEIAVGEILYLKAKSPAPILVVGKPTVGGWYHLQEYQADGTVTGIMSFRIEGETTHDFFFYENVNECGYGFSAHFFKRFVVLRTTSGPGTLGCFGSGVAFDGVYIKLL